MARGSSEGMWVPRKRKFLDSLPVCATALPSASSYWATSPLQTEQRPQKPAPEICLAHTARSKPPRGGVETPPGKVILHDTPGDASGIRAGIDANGSAGYADARKETHQGRPSLYLSARLDCDTPPNACSRSIRTARLHGASGGWRAACPPRDQPDARTDTRPDVCRRHRLVPQAQHRRCRRAERRNWPLHAACYTGAESYSRERPNETSVAATPREDANPSHHTWNRG